MAPESIQRRRPFRASNLQKLPIQCRQRSDNDPATGDRAIFFRPQSSQE